MAYKMRFIIHASTEKEFDIAARIARKCLTDPAGVNGCGYVTHDAYDNPIADTYTYRTKTGWTIRTKELTIG
jgi:hypothetical protein